ncbi:MAG: CsiV family protein [Enterobacterales bacterium]|nr:CsiV family protein [Enterobacterales bacterium]
MSDSLAINELKMSYSHKTSSSKASVLPTDSEYTAKSASRSVVLIGLLSIVFATLSQFSIAAESNDTGQPEAPRWFEVEVILFKLTSDAGLTNESWDKEVQLEMPQQLIDFLQPYEIPEDNVLQPQQQDNSQQSGNDENQTQVLINPMDTAIEGSSNNSSQNPLLTDANNPEQAQGFEEIPFQPLDESRFQLNKEAQSIEKNSRYHLVTHVAWRQPVFSRSQSQPVRLAGGIDYHDTFDYEGSKKIESIAIEPRIFEDGLNQSESAMANEESMLQESDQYNEITLDQETQTDPPSTELADDHRQIALPWVPEIDGSAKVYIQRNYLHFDTKLYYRRPDKEEVDIISLNSGKYMLQSGDYSVDTELQSDNNAIEGVDFTEPEQPQTTIESDNTIQTTSIDSDFSWQFDDDFLNQDTEKVYTERLFNYPLIQTRRLRSGELHYFDHPLIGILVMIRPYQTETEQQASELDATEE